VREHPVLSVRTQCDLLGLHRSGLYYEPAGETELNLALMRLIDEQYTRTPFYGSRRLAWWLGTQGHDVNRKRVQRLMRLMGLEALYPKPNLSRRNPAHEVYPYLLRDLVVDHANQVWCADITYIPMNHGFLYLVAIMDWYSRYVLSWVLSNTLDASFCLESLGDALTFGTPEIFNTDQGCQFTSKDFTKALKKLVIRISMDGRGRALDNVFIERLWRSLKYEEVYLHDYATMAEARRGIGNYLTFYNTERPHQALEYQTPFEVHFGRPPDLSLPPFGQQRRRAPTLNPKSEHLARSILN
jgi:putative transposase